MYYVLDENGYGYHKAKEEEKKNVIYWEEDEDGNWYELTDDDFRI